MDKTYVDSVVKELFASMANENVRINASDGGTWQYLTRMGSCIEGAQKCCGNAVVLNIPNYDLFIQKVSEYCAVAEQFYCEDKQYFMIEGREYSKRVILDLFLNATSYDFYNVYKYIERKKKNLQTRVPQKKFEIGKLCIGDRNLTILANIKRLKFNMEAPYAFEVSFCDEKEEFILPSVLFGISGSTAEIFAIQNLHKNQQSELKKKLDRYFRKIDAGIVQKGIDKIPYEKRNMEECVTINSVVCCAVFVNFFQNFGITKFVSPDFSPLRYSTKFNQKIDVELRKNKNQDMASLEERVEEDMNKNQFNMTDKLFNTLLRLVLHFDNLAADYNPERCRIALHVTKKEYNKTGNLLQEIVEAVTKHDHIETSCNKKIK